MKFDIHIHCEMITTIVTYPPSHTVLCACVCVCVCVVRGLQNCCLSKSGVYNTVYQMIIPMQNTVSPELIHFAKLTLCTL